MSDFLFILICITLIGSFVWSAVNWVMVWWHLDQQEGPSESGHREWQVLADAFRGRDSSIVPASLHRRLAMSLWILAASLLAFLLHSLIF
jgi:hypothetical protein